MVDTFSRVIYKGDAMLLFLGIVFSLGALLLRRSAPISIGDWIVWSWSKPGMGDLWYCDPAFRRVTGALLGATFLFPASFLFSFWYFFLGEWEAGALLFFFTLLSFFLAFRQQPGPAPALCEEARSAYERARNI